MAWSWSKGYTNPPGSSTTPPASTPPPATPPATTPSTGSNFGGLGDRLSSRLSDPKWQDAFGTIGEWLGSKGGGGGISGLFGDGGGSGGVNTNPPGPGGEFSTPQVGPTTPPRFPGQGTPGGGGGGGDGGGGFDLGDWLSRLRGGGDSGGGSPDFSSILSGLRDRFGQGGTSTPGAGGTSFGEMPINGLPQGLQSTITNRWNTIGGGQPMPTTLGPFFDQAKSYYAQNPPIQNRPRFADWLDRT